MMSDAAVNTNGAAAGSWGEHSQSRTLSVDLRKARVKTATGNLTNPVLVQHTNEGRRGGMIRELTPMTAALAELP